MICSGEFGGLHFFNAGNLVSRGEFIHQRRVMKCWVLIYVLSGRLDISSGETCRSVASGEWLFLKPGEEHFGTAPSEGELSYLWAHFSPETPFFEGESGAAYTLPEYGRASSQRISVIFRQLVDCSRRNMYTTRMTECALEMLLTELTQEHLDSRGTGRASNPLIEDINEWIRLNCHRQITINDVAEEFHYNPEYLSSLYSRETGSTLTRSIVMARVDISKRMLSDRNMSIKEAAFSCGFNDEKYYMRVFRKIEGMTPGQYRSAIGVK